MSEEAKLFLPPASHLLFLPPASPPASPPVSLATSASLGVGIVCNIDAKHPKSTRKRWLALRGVPQTRRTRIAVRRIQAQSRTNRTTIRCTREPPPPRRRSCPHFCPRARSSCESLDQLGPSPCMPSTAACRSSCKTGRRTDTAPPASPLARGTCSKSRYGTSGSGRHPGRDPIRTQGTLPFRHAASAPPSVCLPECLMRG